MQLKFYDVLGIRNTDDISELKGIEKKMPLTLHRQGIEPKVFGFEIRRGSTTELRPPPTHSTRGAMKLLCPSFFCRVVEGLVPAMPLELSLLAGLHRNLEKDSSDLSR